MNFVLRSMPSKYKHIFFDLDHTLWDHDLNTREALFEIYDEHKIESFNVHVEEFIDRYIIINRKFWKKYRNYKVSKENLRKNRFKNTFTSLNIRFEEEVYDQISLSYIDKMSQQKHLITSALELLNYLNESYDLHIITNGFREIQFRKLSHSGILPYFENIIVSEDVGKHKPHPKVFKHALDLSSANSSDSIMVGDNLEADILGAKSVGIDQIYLNSSGRPHEEEVTYEVRQLGEILNIL
ncbi:MAG: noncanonical pyrimidine nucleotidase, YjjG family [Chitinophagales bacterium]|nr:noncanonical pyrimidine nucleotidase, YjjG family [Chitinophagales bacterium]